MAYKGQLIAFLDLCSRFPKAALSDEMIGFWVIVIMSDIADLA